VAKIPDYLDIISLAVAKSSFVSFSKNTNRMSCTVPTLSARHGRAQAAR
jgi:hypothetical protein